MIQTRHNNRSTHAWLGLAIGGGILAARAFVRSSRRMDLRGKVVLITGGSRGLGLAMARAFAEQGCRLALCARDRAELLRAADDLRGRGTDVLPVPCDVTDRDNVEQLVRDVVGHFGTVDVLVNNAGVIEVGPVETMTVQDYHEAMRIHFHAPLLLTMEVLPVMRARRAGRIVNISSIGGKIAVPHLLPYTASKFALTGFSQGLRAELAKDGILVTTVCPSTMRTGSPRHAIFKGRHQEEYRWFAISDALPLLSISAHRAARRIVAAARNGDAEIMVSLPSRLACTFHGLFPGLTSDLLGLLNRLLPTPGGIGPERALGKDSESPLTRSRLTALNQSAAQDLNQMPQGLQP